jgi:hypothetical protein
MISSVEKDFSEISVNLESIYINSKLAIIKMSIEVLSQLGNMEKENSTALFTNSHLKDRITKCKEDAESCINNRMKKTSENNSINGYMTSLGNDRFTLNRNF